MEREKERERDKEKERERKKDRETEREKEKGKGEKGREREREREEREDALGSTRGRLASRLDGPGQGRRFAKEKERRPRNHSGPSVPDTACWSSRARLRQETLCRRLVCRWGLVCWEPRVGKRPCLSGSLRTEGHESRSVRARASWRVGSGDRGILTFVLHGSSFSLRLAFCRSVARPSTPSPGSIPMSTCTGHGTIGITRA